MDTAATVQICPSCQQVAPSFDVFCPHCGKSLKEGAQNIGLLHQVLLYLGAILLPPVGLWPGLKYLRSSNPQTRKVGLICIVLTVVSIIATIWLAQSFLANFNTPQLSGTLKDYQQLLNQ